MKSVKLVTIRKKGAVLLVRRRSDGLWSFPGGKRKRTNESVENCLRRELAEELPKLRLRNFRLWTNLKGRSERRGRKMSDAVFLARRVKGRLTIGAPKEIDRAAWRNPWKLALTPTARHLRDRLVAMACSAAAGDAPLSRVR
jgi:8-oxo-dGTP diphosphatase